MSFQVSTRGADHQVADPSPLQSTHVRPQRKTVLLSLPGELERGVRKIPKNHNSVTGMLYTLKGKFSQGFESTLERDAMILAEMDPTVKSFVGQPVSITYTATQKGKPRARVYTPDLLITFKPDRFTGITPRPWLVEVKPRAILIRDFAKFKARFHAARRYAAHKGWTFRLLTEQEIRVDGFLDNLKFLRPHLRRGLAPQWGMAMLDTLLRKRECTVDQLMGMVCKDKEFHPQIVHNLWHLIGTRQVWTDLAIPLTNASVIHHATEPDLRFNWGPAGPPLRTRAVPMPPKEVVIASVSTPRLRLKPGFEVVVDGKRAHIQRVCGSKEVRVQYQANGMQERVSISSLKPYVPTEPLAPTLPHFMELDEEDAKKAIQRAAILRPLLGVQRDNAMVAAAAKELDTSITTIYRLLRRFADCGELTTALAPGKSGGGRGKPRLSKSKGVADHHSDQTVQRFESLIAEAIDRVFLSRKKPTPAATARWFHDECKKQNLPKPWPSTNTIRNRIKWVDDETRIRRREGKAAANQAFRVVKGEFPGANYPLAYVQIDHTKMNVILVDPETRKHLGRAWITVMIDVYSRMVVGFHISYEAPGNDSLGSCLYKAFMTKEKLLAEYQCKADWPCWGVPGSIHGDNAKEFRGDFFIALGQDYGFNIEWRAVKKPRYGAHIERFMGTLSIALRELDGTTFASIAERGDYNSRKYAYLTIEELEQWTANLIVGNYHNRPHDKLDGETPLERWERGINGDENTPPCGLPDILPDTPRTRMDFLPFFKRKVNPSYGVQIDDLQYHDDILVAFYNAKCPKNPKEKRDFVIRRDPADISQVYLLDPKTNNYLVIPMRNTAHPKGITLWEWKATQKLKRKNCSDEKNEEIRFAAILANRKIEAAAREKSSQARRNEVRRNRDQKRAVKHPKAISKPAARPKALESLKPAGEILPCVGIE
ncbi:MAG: TnsA endonuclease N-terminal domain-containing protein [Acidobacteria bacterium]|nr:TnsA endonuclease N-terminal domain-containing protein [Acidobacteriota bacterium]